MQSDPFDASVTHGRAIFATAEYPVVLFVSDALAEAIGTSGLTDARFMWKLPAG